MTALIANKMKKYVSTAIASVLFVVIVVPILQVISTRNPQEPWLTADKRMIEEAIGYHQANSNWKAEKVPLVDHVSIEGAAMVDNPPHDRKDVYEFNVDGRFVMVFVYYTGDTVDRVHIANFGSDDPSVNDFYIQMSSLAPTSSKGGSAMKSWVSEQ